MCMKKNNNKAFGNGEDNAGRVVDIVEKCNPFSGD